MKLDDAESLIPLYRAGRRAESRVQKAVTYAEGHDTLRQKLSDQMEFDEKIVDVIHFIKPPENLRQKLREVSARPHPDQAGLRSHLFHPAMLTALLGVLLIVGFVVWTVMERMEKFAGRESVERMLAATTPESVVEVDRVTTTAGALGDWFYMRGFEGYAVPPEVAALPAVGSRVFPVENHRVAQILIDRHDSILYVFHASDFGIDLAADQPWRLLEFEDWSAALRRHGDVCYMLAFRGKKEELRAFLVALKP